MSKHNVEEISHYMCCALSGHCIIGAASNHSALNMILVSLSWPNSLPADLLIKYHDSTANFTNNDDHGEGLALVFCLHIADISVELLKKDTVALP